MRRFLATLLTAVLLSSLAAAAPTKSIRPAKDGANVLFGMGFLDESGLGSGPWDAIHTLVDNLGNLISSTNPLPVAQPALIPLGYQQITLLSTSTALTVPTGATQVLVKVSGAVVRYRDDGTAPTASVGFPVDPGSVISYRVSPLSAVRFIQAAPTATLDILYYK